jgi:hypothetical protein
MVFDKYMRWAIVFAIAGSALSPTCSGAASPSQILGKWVETGPNGTEMVTEFTTRTISSYGLDQSGKRVGDSKRFPVTYRVIDASTIEADTGAGDRILLHIRGADMIDMEFPGVGTHTMTRDNP